LEEVKIRKKIVSCLYQLFEVSLQGQHSEHSQLAEIVSTTSKKQT
jgi:hypothetical protein